ncbi:MAG: DUF5320 domain-containing protein [Desulfobulbaceae bacterium]|nr:DUF5320 domain-containing protein [Desulfobulbaceae bacterium]
MPGFNQKGPDGAGAMTGRQAGMCRRTEDQSLGCNRGDGTGDGAGRGGGRGMGSRRGQGQGLSQGRRFDRDTEQPQSVGVGRSSSEELSNLKEQYKAAQKTLSMIEQKIAALESGK